MFSVLLLSPLCPHTPLKLPRIDVTYQIRFYGNADRVTDGSGRAIWQGGQEVLAVAYDVMIPGYGTKTTNNLRLWESKPKRGFDLNSFNGEDALHFVFSGCLSDILFSWELRGSSRGVQQCRCHYIRTLS
jgi:glucan phosphorylase